MRILQYVVILGAISATLVACASGSSSTVDEQGSDQEVSGKPPAQGEDVVGELPDGPEVKMGSARSNALADSPQTEGKSDGEEPADAAATVTRPQLDGFIQKGPSFALTMVQVEPSRADGTFQGFEIVSMKPGAKTALEPHLGTGDVITHINGVRLEKPDDYLDAWKLLSEVSQIRIDFLRDGTPQHASWQVR